jgi:outer membrane immunogenic protein
MKKFLVAGITAAAFFSAPTLAADMPVKMPVRVAPPAPVFSWNGCYLGGDVGYAWERDRDVETAIATGAVTASTPPKAAEPNGVKGGLYTGCNWQAAAPWVFGIEGDIEATSIEGKAFYGDGLTSDFYRSRTPWEGSIRARLGYAVNRSLLYFTGGWALARFDEFYLAAATGLSFTHRDNRSGWTVGAGWDYAMAPNWIFRLEYRYADFGKFTDGLPNPFGPALEHHNVTEHAIRVGIAYKFDWGKAPIVAKY